MEYGKRKCKILREIRQRIAEANDIEFATSDCRFNGACPGTCPKCEHEVEYLEHQLNKRHSLGKAIVLAGLSVGLLSFSSDLPPADPSADTPPPPSNIDENKVYDIVGQINTDPIFPGGQKELLKFIAQNYCFPKIDGDFQGRIIVRFMVDENGKVGNPEILKSPLPEVFNQEALRVISILPDFKPAEIAGKPIAYPYIVPINIKPTPKPAPKEDSN